MNFSDFDLNDKLLRAVAEQGYTEPSPIQCQAIPYAVKGRDILGCAQTGTGKTAAFALPILQRMTSLSRQNERRKIRALILTPTRELALQIDESFKTYGKYLPLKCGVIMGGVGQGAQIDMIRRGIDILVATPGRLNDLYNQAELDLSGIEFFVLDEADRMLDMGFIHDVKKVIKVIPQKRQTLFFTATLPPEITSLAKSLLTDPAEVAVTPVSSTVDTIEQTVYMTDKDKKKELLVHLMKEGQAGDSVLIFTRTKYGADKLVRFVRSSGIEALAIHGDKSQGARQNALESFKNGKIRALIATDIAARGIDIEDLSCVVNYELPNVPETYVHRIGRTGRAGKSGIAIALCDFDEKPYLTDIEKLIKRKLTVVEQNPYPMTVFVKSPPKVAQPRPQKNFRK